MNKAEEIGARVIAAKERKLKYIEKMTPAWKETGMKLRRIREGLKISRREIAHLIGASVSVIRRMEAGMPIKRRRVIETSYRTMLHCIPLLRMEDAGVI